MPLNKPQTQEGRPGIRQRLATLKAAASHKIQGTRAASQEGTQFPVEACPDGSVPYPFDRPQGFLAISDMIPTEAKRLLSIAQDEFERRAAYYVDFDPARAGELRANISRTLRLDELARLALDRLPVAQEADAELLALEAEFWEADAARCAASDRQDEARDACAQVPMPDALRVHRLDWVHPGIPQPRMTSLGNGTARVHPYGKEEVEFLRANPCMVVAFGGSEGELQADGVTRLRPHKQAQDRADAIVAAWDPWQADRTAAREAVGLPEIDTAYNESEKRRDAILSSARQSPATSLAGLAAKARIAADLCGYDIVGSPQKAVSLLREGAERTDPTDDDGMLLALLADVLELTGAAARG